MDVIADFVFAHGAGAGKESDFMQHMAALLKSRGIRVHLFNFDYMEQALKSGKRRPPSKMPVLVEEFSHFVTDLSACSDPGAPLFIGGKSMGSRVACEFAAMTDLDVCGVIAYGYPFHPPKKPEKQRLATLVDCPKPCLVIQGENDALGSRDEVDAYALPSHIRCHYIATANHDLKPLKRSGMSYNDSLVFTADQTLKFIKEH